MEERGLRLLRISGDSYTNSVGEAFRMARLHSNLYIQGRKVTLSGATLVLIGRGGISHFRRIV